MGEHFEESFWFSQRYKKISTVLPAVVVFTANHISDSRNSI